MRASIVRSFQFLEVKRHLSYQSDQVVEGGTLYQQGPGQFSWVAGLLTHMILDRVVVVEG